MYLIVIVIDCQIDPSKVWNTTSINTDLVKPALLTNHTTNTVLCIMQSMLIILFHPLKQFAEKVKKHVAISSWVF